MKAQIIQKDTYQEVLLDSDSGFNESAAEKITTLNNFKFRDTVLSTVSLNVEEATFIDAINALQKAFSAQSAILVIALPENFDSDKADKHKIEWAPSLDEARDLMFMLQIEKELNS
jgi:hypothetical protein